MLRRSTWVLLGIFFVLAGLTWYFQRNQSEKTSTITATPTTTIAYLYNLDSAEVSEVLITDKTGNQIDLYKDGDTSRWTVRDIPIEQVDSFQIESVLAQLFAIQSTDTMTETLPLDSIGLADPAYTINLKTSGSNEVITNIGSQTAIGSGYYVRIGDGAINIVEKITLDAVLDLLSSPPLIITATPEAGLPNEIEPVTTPTQ